MTPTVVVLRAIGLGDLLTGLPALRLLRAAMPGHRLVALVPAAQAGLLTASGLVDEVVPTPGLGLLHGAPLRPTVALDLHGNGAASRAPLLALAPDRLVAFGPTAPWDPAEHEVARWCRLVRTAFRAPGLDPPVAGLLPVFGVPCGHDAGLTVLHPGAASGSRRWPADRFAAVASALSERGHRVVVTGGPTEVPLVDTVLAAATAARPATGLDLVGLAGLVAHARLVVAGDTGPAHLAAAYGVPSVTLHGPVSPARWGPPPSARHRSLWPARPDEPEGDPHGARLDPVLARTTVAEVLATVADLDRVVGAR